MCATVAVLLALVTGLVAACGSQQPSPAPSMALALASATAAPSAPPSAMPSSTPIASATPVATATPGMTREPTAKPTPVPWKSYTSKTYHYKISYPPTWIVTPGPSGSADQFDQYTYPYVWIYRDASGSFASPKLTASRDIAYDKSHYAAKVITNRAIKVNGWSGRIVTLGGMWHGRKVQIVDLVVAKGRIGYGLEIFGNADTAAADLATFKRMYSSWRPT